MFETITLEVADGVANVTLNRPDVRNAFNATMIAELTEAFVSLGERDHVFTVVLSGSGLSFSAGADATWMRAALDFSEEENLADALRMSDMFAAINAVPQTVICRVHGASLGGGLGLMAACDIVVAADDCVFGFTEARLGIVPAVISRFVFGKIGSSWARALYLTAERFDSDVARQIGLVHWVTKADSLDDAVRKKISALRQSGPLAVQEAKSLISLGVGLGDAELRLLTARTIARVRTTPEAQEGLRAFLDKRRPSWLPEGND